MEGERLVENGVEVVCEEEKEVEEEERSKEVEGEEEVVALKLLVKREDGIDLFQEPLELETCRIHYQSLSLARPMLHFHTVDTYPGHSGNT